MRILKTSVLFAALTLTSAAQAAALGVSITEQPRPGVPQARWTTVKVDDVYSQNQNAKFNYSVSNYSVNLKWTTNTGATGGCNIYYDVNKDNSTNFNDQVAKRRYDTTKAILTSLKQGDELFIQSAFGRDGDPCEVTLKHSIGL
ncbi:hypothetical protein A7985_10080 [Pseudoalteromonas luteoviolacea]|uniref:Uncharacterized protein n=1 Tax=Pseudoalteromonas luteoviolacea TaxID=43657 RepID=A0A1C0TSA0_9GAMM|nr:hypothetical protein [Pseudoalteromonas luteoviolacea]MBQ4810784.1 hypothetical protein [Pseudoalteromonas luteoviolacea]OCQ22129.1 hypothetical protein A7985_10080 [Pseudoalteromonas luteoviolacea]